MEMPKIVYKLMENELMRLLFSGVTDLTYIYDTEGNVLFVNKIFEKFTGHRPEEFYGKPFATLFDEDNLKKAMDAFTSTLKGESPQYELCFKNTKILCEYRNFPLRDEKGKLIGVMGIARDITARKQAEEGLLVLNESLEKRMIEHSSRLMELNEELMGEIDARKRQENESKQSIEKLQKSLRGIIQTLALTVESRDPYSAGHQKRVAHLACCIAEEMSLSKDRIAGVRLAALLHDIGKISIPEEILNKSVQLTKAELSVIRNHTQVGYDILKEIEFPWSVAQIVLQHHERVNGSGYPFGLSGKDIHLEAKILSVADVIDAMTSPRPYRHPFPLDKALNEISHNRGILYDFNVVCACLAIFNEKAFKFEQENFSNSREIENLLLKV
ncbi:MAG: HD domain-containing protein [Candidatus Brocadia sp.]|nr:HD domain-containing protein [Candidatus Brocadia sp.]